MTKTTYTEYKCDRCEDTEEAAEGETPTGWTVVGIGGAEDEELSHGTYRLLCPNCGEALNEWLKTA